MNYPSIRIEGAILSPDILTRLEEANGQRPLDFGFDSSRKVKDEIVRAWADAQDYWRIFQRKLEAVKVDNPATTETRSLWVVPFLSLLGYELEYQQKSVELNGKTYAISHRLSNRGRIPVHIVGYREPAGLDRKPEKAVLRMSAHGMVQEYLNLTDGLYGLVTNGRVLRLLRDSSRLVKLTYLEFDLDRIFNDGLFADFAVLYRLLHASRLPVSPETSAECIIERYHQDSLDSGARIRDGLSRAVESAIREFANGFLAHPANDSLRQTVVSDELEPDAYYQHLLRLIYRLLFLMVIEERGLVFPVKSDASKRDIYEHYYSLQRLRRLSEKRYLADRRKNDHWLSLLTTFRLFEAGGPGQKLGIAPLAGDLFSPFAIGQLGGCTLGNDVLLGCLRSLGLYQHPDTGQVIRVNYAALNVEEFGSVYEGLLEYKPVFIQSEGVVEFDFAPGDQRAVTGSHYTPDDLVQPLIKHSLDYLIADKLKESDREKALLSLRVADISCGSGHILLAAARRIATELAAVRTGEEQPSPAAFRTAVRDVIRECIYGVDLNPLAVELCKVALWLEAHNPGEPLNFLDHHIKCGNAIVGYARWEDVIRGVPDEAFITMPGDDKDISVAFRRRNKSDRANIKQVTLNYSSEILRHRDAVLTRWRELSNLPDRTPSEFDIKKQRYIEFTNSTDAILLEQIAAIPIAQFYLPKTTENQPKLTTDSDFRLYWSGERHPQGQSTAEAWSIAHGKRFFHWFLEFPDIIERGGFDCILGNPPYLGGTHLSGTYGYSFCNYVKWEYAPTGLSDLVAYFVRRIYTLLSPDGITALITTNSIKDGDIRKDGLEQVIVQGGAINFVVRGIKWPGRANIIVSLVGVHKGQWRGKCFIDNREVSVINAYFEDSQDTDAPLVLKQNADVLYEGAKWQGDGFLLNHDEARRMIDRDPRNRDVIFPIINGHELNNHPEQQPEREIINFFDWPLERAQKYSEPIKIVEDRVKPMREKEHDKGAKGKWWIFLRPRMEMTSKIKGLPHCFVAAATTKYLSFSAAPTNIVFSHALKVFTTDRWDLYAVVQSGFHEAWARKYSGALKQDLRYSPSKCFDTFPFPEGLWQTTNAGLTSIGNRYHDHRSTLMRQLWLGLTDIYNLFHDRGMTPSSVAKVSMKTLAESEAGYKGILELRYLHQKLDEAIRDAYGWNNLSLGHDFYEIDTLSENDRIRFTISPGARQEVLKRLLKRNYEIHQQEVNAGLWEEKEVRKVKIVGPESLFLPLLPDIDVDALAATSYPANVSDRTICAAALSIVEYAGVLSSMDHLDALLLATHPEWCKTFLDKKDHAGFRKAVASAPRGLFVETGQSIRWSDCRGHLEQHKAVVIIRAQAEQTINSGLDLLKVKKIFPEGAEAVVKYALKALAQIKTIRTDLLISPEQQAILHIFDQQHKEYALAA